MADVDLLVGWPSENVAGDGTVTASPEDPDYPASYLTDSNVARPAKLTATSGTFLWDFGLAQRIDWITFGPHNLAGGTVTFEGNATDSWGAPSLTTSITIPANLRDGQSVQPWKDLTAVSGYTTTGYRYWRLSVSGAAAVAIGEVWLASTKRFVTNLRIEAEFARSRRAIEHVTEYGVSTVYDLGVLLRQVNASWLDSTTRLADLLDWWHDCQGRSLITPIVIDQSSNEAMFVRHMTELAHRRLVQHDSTTVGVDEIGTFILTEVGRGLPL